MTNKPSITDRDPFYDLSARAFNALRAAGVEYIEDAQNLKMTELTRLPGVGKKTIEEITSWLKMNGIWPTPDISAAVSLLRSHGYQVIGPK